MAKDPKSYTLSEKQRHRLEKRLEDVEKQLSSAGMEWFPKEGQRERLEAEKRSLSDTLQYDDMLREEAEETLLDERD